MGNHTSHQTVARKLMGSNKVELKLRDKKKSNPRDADIIPVVPPRIICLWPKTDWKITAAASQSPVQFSHLGPVYSITSRASSQLPISLPVTKKENHVPQHSSPPHRGHHLPC